jgi:hypothetical protein
MYSYIPLAHHLLDPIVFQAPCQYRKQIESLALVLYSLFISFFLIDCVVSVMAHAQKPEFVLLRLECDGTLAETRFLSYCVWNVMAHAQKPDLVLLLFKYDGSCAETRFRLTAFKM